MSHENLATGGHVSAFISLLSAASAWIAINSVKDVLAIIASLVAITSGFLACRYYLKATNRISKP